MAEKDGDSKNYKKKFYRRKRFNNKFGKSSDSDKILYFKRDDVNAADIMAESVKARSDKMVTFDCSSGRSKMELNNWFKEFNPMTTKRSDGIGWIAILSDSYTEADKAVIEGSSDDEALLTDWDNLIKDESKEVDYVAIKDLAERHNIKGGKWMFKINQSERMEDLWKRIALSVAYNRMPAGVIGAKISPVDDSGEDTKFPKWSHIVCICNRNFFDEDEIFGAEKALRAIPMMNQLMYKPNVYSSLGIYRNNEYKLRPTIYTSNWKAADKHSIIESVLEVGWTFQRPKNDDLSSHLQSLKFALTEASKSLDRMEAELEKVGIAESEPILDEN